MYRERDPLLELWKHEHDQMLQRIQRVADGDEGKPTLQAIAVQLRSLADAKDGVLAPAFAKVSLALDAQRLLEDCRDDLAILQRALDALARALRSPTLRKLRALQLGDLVRAQAERYGERLIPVLQSQLSRPLYRALASAFIARHGAEPAPRRPRSNRRELAPA